jgi:6-phosphogluconate dehydrogenase
VKSDVGVIGLAVMGQNLILNLADQGFKVSAYNRTHLKVDEFVQGTAKGKSIFGFKELALFLQSLERPRKVLLMVKAGDVVDEWIQQLIPLMEPGDIIIDGGNSLYTDTERRVKELQNYSILFIGSGISGGEEGARHGPSIMPGGSAEAWSQIKPIFQKISAHVFPDQQPCCDWIGPGGSGHYVKMVHNGIEYGDMQLIAESFHLLKQSGLSFDQMADVFDEWNKGPLESYLIEITAKILRKKDVDSSPLVEKILDTAGQKGTGKWTSIDALNRGSCLTLISEAVFSRILSSLKEQRSYASQFFSKPPSIKIEPNLIEKALYASKIMSYTQGFMLLKSASTEMNWNLNLGSIAMLWRGGCIIRSKFLNNIKQAFDISSDLPCLFLDPFFQNEVKNSIAAWREVVSKGVLAGVSLPCLSGALSFFDAYTSEKLPANLLQAQRDCFGAHQYERIDTKRGEFFHTDWLGTGGNVSSTVY